MQEIVFPQYRKMTGFKRFYCIHSMKSFTEISFLGTQKKTQKIEATQYPEMVRIMDMLEMKTVFTEMDTQEIEAYFAFFI